MYGFGLSLTTWAGFIGLEAQALYMCWACLAKLILLGRQTAQLILLGHHTAQLTFFFFF